MKNKYIPKYMKYEIGEYAYKLFHDPNVKTGLWSDFYEPLMKKFHVSKALLSMHIYETAPRCRWFRNYTFDNHC